MAAAGAVGLVEWPVVLTVGGAALVLRQLHERGAPTDGSRADEAGAEDDSAAESSASRPPGRAT